MKIALDEMVSFEFDQYALERASQMLDMAREKNPEAADTVLRAMLTLLVMGQVEQQHPGTLSRIISASSDVAEALDGPKAGNTP